MEIVAEIFQFLLNKPKFCCGNYSKEETIEGQNIYEEIRYLSKNLLFFTFR